MNKESPSTKDRAFKAIERSLVITTWVFGVVLLSFLALLIFENIVNGIQNRKFETTLNRIIRISNAAVTYRDANGKLPSGSDPRQILLALSSYTKYKLDDVDGWGWPMRVFISGDEIVIWSPGRDGKFRSSIPEHRADWQGFDDDLICVGYKFRIWPADMIRD